MSVMVELHASGLAFCAVLLLAGCGTGPETTTNPHTGVTVHRSAEAALDRSPASAFYARAVAFEAGGQTRFALLTRVVRSDLNYPVIESAWSHGRRLPYDKGDRRRVGCGTATGCLREEVGSVPMSRGLFEAADRAGGLTLQLVGRRGSYTGHVPGAAFAEVLRRAGRGPP